MCRCILHCAPLLPYSPGPRPGSSSCAGSRVPRTLGLPGSVTTAFARRPPLRCPYLTLRSRVRLLRSCALGPAGTWASSGAPRGTTRTRMGSTWPSGLTQPAVLRRVMSTGHEPCGVDVRARLGTRVMRSVGWPGRPFALMGRYLSLSSGGTTHGSGADCSRPAPHRPRRLGICAHTLTRYCTSRMWTLHPLCCPMLPSILLCRLRSSRPSLRDGTGVVLLRG